MRDGRPRTRRVCIAFEVSKINKEHNERINQIRKIQLENDITFNEAKAIYNKRMKKNNEVELLELSLFGEI